VADNDSGPAAKVIWKESDQGLAGKSKRAGGRSEVLSRFIAISRWTGAGRKIGKKENDCNQGEIGAS